MHLPIDYPTLRVIWWLLMGLLLIAFAVTDGWDLGVGILLYQVARNEDERHVLIETLGPFWEGNQIWLILGAGAIFAAWPDLYAVAFSGFYFAMLLVLLALIIRPVGFKYRNKIHNAAWRNMWDFCIFLNGLIPTFIFGVAIGNVLQGVPFEFDTTLRSYYTGTLLQLFNPFGLLCGVVSVCMLMMHGALYLTIKTKGILQERARQYGRITAIATIVFFALGGLWIATRVPGYVLAQPMLLDLPSNPLHKKILYLVNGWMVNYTIYPFFKLAPISGFVGALLAILFCTFRYFKLAFLMSALSITGIIATVGASMFPVILPSSTHPDFSLLVWDASSSQLTLLIMLFASAIFIPIIIAYTSWVHYVMREKVTSRMAQRNEEFK